MVSIPWQITELYAFIDHTLQIGKQLLDACSDKLVKVGLNVRYLNLQTLDELRIS